MKKTGLGKDPLSWIKPTAVKRIRQVLEDKVEKMPAPSQVPKFKTFTVRLTTLLRDDQLEFLEKLVREIRKNRGPEYRKERITKNTIFRALLDAFMQAKLDLANIPDEDTLRVRLQSAIKS